MYQLNTKLTKVRGIGPKTFKKLKKSQITIVRDLLLQLPLRYEDRSHFTTIANLPEGELVTIQAKVESTKQIYRKGSNMQQAMVSDATGKLKLIWFNNKYILNNLKEGQEYLFSGKYSGKYKNMTHPKMEKPTSDSIHTGRLVPLYSSTIPLQEGRLRRILKNITDKLAEVPDPIVPLLEEVSAKIELPDFTTAISQLHFPDEIETVAQARERLALEEFLTIMQTSQQIKQAWQQKQARSSINLNNNFPKILPIPDDLPFKLTEAQKRSLTEILTDLSKTTPMNRLLVGDVGSGKTVVAAIAAKEMLAAGEPVALVAPTKILAQQHQESIEQLFPDLPVKLLTGQTKQTSQLSESGHQPTNQPQFYIGTHAVINQINKIKPGLIIYDEQHRFGVMQRSQANNLTTPAHILTMTATPIPRSLMLTIFSHLQMSYLDEMPAGRKPVTTWLVPEKKRQSSYDWLAKELKEAKQQALIVCPFINPSDHEAFEKVAAATKKYDELINYFANSKHEPTVALLHGQQKKSRQETIVNQLYNQEIDILVTTPIVEVGIDLPKAAIIVIESAERFGLASLHQLRGRVGRAGQESYCLLFTNSTTGPAKKRLKQFSNINDGKKLAELDLENRGSGDIFGTSQSGFSQLEFGSWTNVDLIKAAQTIYDQLPDDWQPIFTTSEQKPIEELPLAN